MAVNLEMKGRRYHQVQSLRDVTRDNFPNGQIRFNFSIPAQESWNPYLSFFTIRSDFSKYEGKGAIAGAGISVINTNMISGIGPNMFFNDSLWQQLELKINGITINKQDNYVHQIAALRHRLYPEDRNRTLNKLNFPDPDLYDRASKLGGGYGDLRSAVEPKDMFDLIGDDTKVQIPAVVAGGIATLTISTNLESNLTRLVSPGAAIAVKYDDGVDNFLVHAKVLTVTKLTLTYTSPKGGSLNAGGAANLVADQIWLGFLRSNGRDATDYQKIETIWKPKLGFFDLDMWLPGGEYEIILTPFPSSSYRKNAVEVDTFWFNNINDTLFEVISMEFNLCGSAQPSIISEIAFSEIRCQAKTINTTSLSQKQFNINPKSHALTVAYQDNRVQTDLRVSSSKFKIYDFANNNNSWELKISRFYIQYDGEVLPNPIPDIRVTESSGLTEDYIAQRYWETQHYKIMQYENVETLEDWKSRGAYYHFQWPRRNKDAMEVQVSQEFTGALPEGGSGRPQLLLFEHYICKYKFGLYQGYIDSVKKII